MFDTNQSCGKFINKLSRSAAGAYRRWNKVKNLMPSKKEIKVIEEAFDVRDDWFEDGIGAVQARVSSGNQSNFPIDQINVDNI